MKEIWKDIPDYEGLYKISNYGRIKNAKNLILSPWIARDYLYVSLHKNGTKRKYRVHRLVAQAFIPNPNNYPVINHIDGNKLNNNVNNLEWCTQKTNINKYFEPRRTKEIKPKIKDYHKPKQILQIDKAKNILNIWNSMMDIERNLGIKSGNISNCCNGIRKTAGGYYWKYADE